MNDEQRAEYLAANELALKRDREADTGFEDLAQSPRITDLDRKLNAAQSHDSWREERAQSIADLSRELGYNIGDSK